MIDCLLKTNYSIYYLSVCVFMNNGKMVNRIKYLKVINRD